MRAGRTPKRVGAPGQRVSSVGSLALAATAPRIVRVATSGRRCLSTRCPRRAILLGRALAATVCAATPQRPNLRSILADDLGGGPELLRQHLPQTPHFDRPAEQGKLCTNFHVAGSVCAPSRGSFFISQDFARQRIHGHFATPELNAARGLSQFLEPRGWNVAAALRGAGYTNAHLGQRPLGNDSGGPPIADPGSDHVGSGEGSAGAGIIAGDPCCRAKASAHFFDQSMEFSSRAGAQNRFICSSGRCSTPRLTRGPSSAGSSIASLTRPSRSRARARSTTRA
jgi:hypothetical protein